MTMIDKRYINNIKTTINAVNLARDILRAPTTIGRTDLASLKRLYGDVNVHGALLSCMYEVQIDDIFDIGGDIPWFKNKSLRYLATDTSLSFGTAESDSFQAGAYHANLLTHQTADTMDVTFIETEKGDIFNSYRSCLRKVFNLDGTVNEPKKYTFLLSIYAFNHKKGSTTPPIGRQFLVSVKEGSTDFSASGRSDLLKETITFQKIRPTIFAQP